MSAPNNNVNLTVNDGALSSIAAPPANTQVKIGCAIAGTNFQIFSTASKTDLIANFTGGPLVEASAPIIDAGGAVLAIKVPATTAGAIIQASPLTITAATTASPIACTTAAHGLATGDVVTITGGLGMVAINGTFKVTVVDSTHFTLNGSTGSGTYTASSASAQPLGTHEPGTGTSVVTLTGAPNDAFDFLLTTDVGGTIGTSGILFHLSVDNGRTPGPQIALGTATTYAIAGTGLTLNFAAGTLVAGDTVACITSPPLWTVGDVTTALTAIQNSSFSWGGNIHVVGPCSGANATTLQSNADTMFTAARFTRIIVDTVDTTTGGTVTTQTEAAWMTALQADYAAVSAKRICPGAGYVNFQSPITNLVLGAPNYRRPVSWSAAKRVVSVPFWEHLGKVLTGSLSATSGPGSKDPTIINDGRLYHDERTTPGLDAARFMAVQTFVDTPGPFIKNPNMMAPPGSDYSQLQYGMVMDQACSLTRQVLLRYINSTVRLYPLTSAKAGMILEQDARSIETDCVTVFTAQLIGIGAVSDVQVAVNRADNINQTKKLRATITILSLGYIEEIDVGIGFASPSAAAA